jgi:crossover junction endodeoxyribonuclease RuvC
LGNGHLDLGGGRFSFSVQTLTIRWKVQALRRRLLAMAGIRQHPVQNGWLRVLGVDPAAAGPTGYGIIDSDGRVHRVLRYGALRVATKRQKDSKGAVLHDVHALLCRLLKEYKPNVMAVESIFTALNMRTALRLAEVRGVVLLAAEQFGVAVHSYSPREVKACVAGYGHADKKQMQTMVRALLQLEELPEPTDAADALAVALCHLQAEVLESRYGLSRVKKGSPAVLRVKAHAAAESSNATAVRSPSIQTSR